MDGPETGSPGIHCFSEGRLTLDKDMKQVLLKARVYREASKPGASGISFLFPFSCKVRPALTKYHEDTTGCDFETVHSEQRGI